ncbi:gluconate 2-dehydrogenase subunit 3 family protein [Pedobacter sp. KR3-3]|uniref:Gluconate 2-dehydrogenase subunit 3 family protein n=1 Tax=Pedobacter albus TaxID=3113905 RepID=A0ABU7I672_9SPHI|nr:gluconate 2-dehydrogenase subunit 3 family protein [Pedobacter sp. KR3-3]MEE1944869.1 gluconate 2-dehydrogenase subunit 3 family protein [Pedobacter sp. KR3-3]
MDRRELIKQIALLTGGIMIGGNALLTGCSPNKSAKNEKIRFSQQQQDLLNEIGDTILPPTKSPGAKAANVGAFMEIMVRDCYEEKDQQAFIDGMKKLDEASKKIHGNGFMTINAQQKLAFIQQLDKEASDFQAKKGELEAAERKKDKNFAGLPNHYFIMIKQLTLLGYFTSEVGCTQAMRYTPAPGRYEGDVPYQKGDKAWA